MQADINQQRSENKMKLLALNDEEHSLLQNILNNFVLHGIESVPDDGSCNVLKMNDKINELKDIEPVAWMWPVYHSENNQLTDDPVVSENIEMHLQSHGSPLKVTPLYRLDK